MARPRKNEEKNRPERVTWRISSALKEGLERLSKARSLAVSDVAHDLLEKGLRDAAESRRGKRGCSGSASHPSTAS
jgi:hypothetical protein